MTPAEARNMLTKLPAEWQPLVRRALIGAWGDGFGVGVARLPATNPFATEAPPPGDKQNGSRLNPRKP